MVRQGSLKKRRRKKRVSTGTFPYQISSTGKEEIEPHHAHREGELGHVLDGEGDTG
jgi:hypothetical protein